VLTFRQTVDGIDAADALRQEGLPEAAGADEPLDAIA
jgi:hypothetical protein